MYGINEIDVNELNKQLENLPENVKLIDVRTPAEAARGKISGSENLPLHLIPLKVNEFNNNETIIFYCHSGARSAQACAFMSSKGINNVYNLRGGIATWAQMGMPIAM
jgi:rhodanese-related sulfurtransferase